MTDEVMCCAVCRRVISQRTDLSSGVLTGYEHGPEVDHEAVPVPFREMIDPLVICDFCGDPDDTWTVYVTNWTEFLPGGLLVAGEDWAACKTCGPLIAAGKWQEMTNRAIKRVRKAHPTMSASQVAKSVTRTHRQVRDNFLRIVKED